MNNRSAAVLRATFMTLRHCAIVGAGSIAVVGCTFSLVTAPMAFLGLGNTTTVADIVFDACALFLVGAAVGAVLGAVIGLPLGIILALRKAPTSH